MIDITWLVTFLSAIPQGDLLLTRIKFESSVAPHVSLDILIPHKIIKG